MKTLYHHLLLSALLLSALPAAAQRVALVIGNNQYSELPGNMQLNSPVHDAEDVAAQLKTLGYTLVTGGAVTDATRDTLTNVTEQFAAAARGAEAAVFYFSGHGVQVGEDNYLLPTDTPKLNGISMLKGRTVLLRDSVMVALEEAGAQTKVIILDCCRDNPFAAQLQAAVAGLGKSIKTKSVGEITGYGPGFYLAFATSPGQTASDGNGQRNSPFTAAMLKALPTSAAKDIDFYFRDVKAQLPDDQVSWTNHSIKGEFSLARSGGVQLPSHPDASSSGVVSAMEKPAVSGPTSPTMPPRGYFDLSEVLVGTPYQGFNAYSRAQILMNAQEKLKAAGHYKSAPDGAMGPGTQKAINDWQQQHGLSPSGRLDHATLASLSLENIRESKPPAPKPTNQGGTSSAATRSAKPTMRSPTSRPGFINTPNGLIDVRGFPAGTAIRDPWTGKVIFVP